MEARGGILSQTAIPGYNLIGKLIGANMNTTADQAIPIINAQDYNPRRIVVKNASAPLTLAVGGVYTAASKGGSQLVANTQAYAPLINSSASIDLTLAGLAGSIKQTTQTAFFSLTSTAGSAATADLYMFAEVYA